MVKATMDSFRLPLMLLVFLLFQVTAAWKTSCVDSDGTTGPCGPDFPLCGPPFDGPKHPAPQFHIASTTCGINDPNGPVYDPVHGYYHMFYQEHLAMPQNGKGKGPVYGHVASKDLIQWARLPIAIWNDKPYDSVAIFTGSATVVNGQVMQMYPGICDKGDWENCTTGTNVNLAVPADYQNDPLLTNWTKYQGNPILNNTQRDPSTAWLTQHGEWRFTAFNTKVYGSTNFMGGEWYEIGKNPGFLEGECPSLFPFPRVADNTKNSETGGAPIKFPTHVHKTSIGGKDWMSVGTYTEGLPGQIGSFQPTPGFDFEKRLVDAGNFYACKDFYDPLKQRRINYGWAMVSPGSALSLPREIVWSQAMQELLHVPLKEQESLRGDLLFHNSNVTVQKYFTLKHEQLKQSEAIVNFELPKSPGSFGVVAFAGSNPLSEKGIYFYVNITNDTWDCLRKGKHLLRGEKPDTTLCAVTVGATGGQNDRFFHFTDVLKLSPNEDTLSVQIFSDQTFAECFWQGGRVVMTANNPQQTSRGGELGDNFAIVSDTDKTVVVHQLIVWSVKSIWITPEELLSRKPKRTSSSTPLSVQFS